MSKMVKAAVFASGTGSNFDVIMNTEDLACEITLLVCDNPEAQVIEKANKYGVAVFVFNPKDYPSKKVYEQQIVKKLQEAGISWIFLAGYMRIAGPVLLAAFENRIVNIHPSLLPSFPGKNAIGQAFQAGVKITGVTVHFIDEGIDTGPIIAQVPVAVRSGDTETELKERIQKTEHQLYPKVINQLIQAK